MSPKRLARRGRKRAKLKDKKAAARVRGECQGHSKASAPSKRSKKKVKTAGTLQKQWHGYTNADTDSFSAKKKQPRKWW